MWCNVYMYIYNDIILLYMDILGQLSMLAFFFYELSLENLPIVFSWVSSFGRQDWVNSCSKVLVSKGRPKKTWWQYTDTTVPRMVKRRSNDAYLGLSYSIFAGNCPWFWVTGCWMIGWVWLFLYECVYCPQPIQYWTIGLGQWMHPFQASERNQTHGPQTSSYAPLI